jgi:hypothetical protein
MNNNVRLALIILLLFCESLSAQNVIRENGLVPVLPSADKVLTFEMISIPGTSYFLTTGDDNSRLWDMNSHKMLAKLTNPNVQSASINFTTFFHPLYNLIVQQTFSSISFYSYPDLKIVNTIELNTIQECLFHSSWDFFILSNEQGIEQISFRDFKNIGSFNFPYGSPTVGFTQDSLSVYYEFEGKGFALAPIDQPTAVQWIETADLINREIVEVLSSNLFILEEELVQSSSSKIDFRSSISKSYFFYDVKRKEFSPIKELKSAPENVTYWVNEGKVFFNDASYDNGNSCFVYSSDNLSLIQKLEIKPEKAESDSANASGKPKRIKNKQVEQIVKDEVDGLIWVLFSDGLASFDIRTFEQKSFLKGGYDFIIRVGSGLALLDDEKNIFVIRDYKKSIQLKQIKTDFLDVIYKVKRKNETELDILTQNGMRRLDLRELKVEDNIPLSKEIGLSALDQFQHWYGRYISNEYGSETYYQGEDSVYKKDMQFLYFDKKLNTLYYWNDSMINSISVEKTIDNAELYMDCHYLQNAIDTVDIEYQLDFRYGFGDVVMLQFNSNNDFLYILRGKNVPERSRKNEPGAKGRSKHISIRSINAELIKVNMKTSEQFKYDIPKFCAELISLQNGYFLVKHDASLIERSGRFMSRIYAHFLKDKIVYDNGKSLKVKYVLPIGGELIGDSEGRIEELPFVVVSDRKKVSLVNMPTFDESLIYEYTKSELSDEFKEFDFDPSLNRLVLYSFRGQNVEFDLNGMKEISRFKAHPWQQHSVGHFESSTIYTANNEELKFWKDGECSFQLYFHKNDGFYIRDTSDIYYATKRIIKDMYFVDNKLHPVGFEQLDPFCNRPAQIQESISEYLKMKAPKSNEFLKSAENKRINKLGIGTILNSERHISFPEVRVELPSDFSYEYTVDNLTIEITISDSVNSLVKFNVLVNEVPILGSAGYKIPPEGVHRYTLNYKVPLNVGENKIQVSVMNELGLENFKYPTYVNYTPKKEIESTTFYVGIGVNDFKDASRKLNYCVKDVQDLAQAFAKNQSKVDTLVFTNSEVTKENILALKNYLQKNTTVNDKVIISCSSHGLLDDSLNFYLATYDIDFAHPEIRGLAYEDLEGLLDGIPARQKLLLLDACNSGENERMFLQNNSSDQLAQAGMKGVNVEIVNEEINTFHQMTELFVNVRNNTGSVIIAASGGMQSAQEGRVVEGKKIENGAFTYSVLEYLAKEFNNQEKCTVNGMKNYVESRVEEITNGEQKPTSRQETMEVDWEVK